MATEKNRVFFTFISLNWLCLHWMLLCDFYILNFSWYSQQMLSALLSDDVHGS